MRHLFHHLFLSAAFVAAPAAAAQEPSVAPAPAWVEAVPIPAPDPKLADKPLQLLLVNGQSSYAANGGAEHYVEWATLPQNPQGLAALGTIAIPWQPDNADLVVHKVQLIRAGKAIDLLAGGQKFIVLRRENRLEYAMLDGTLTAVLQSEDLQLGDVVNVAFSLRQKPGSIAFAAEKASFLQNELPTRKLRSREIWPKGIDMRWRATPAMGKPELKQTKLGSELVLELDDAIAPKVPADAPQRFQLPAFMQISAYRDWSDISKLLAPVFLSSQQLDAASPLKAEIARIAAVTSDPRRRALTALELVQDRVRYVALAMGEAGYVPASADQTWSRKYGDCKGKTVTLIALLAGLGIEAEPVLVSTGLGDTLGERLPQVKLFDHVIVRARIDGRSYWLDGTGAGDRDLDALASSGFGWGLPLRTAGAALEQIPHDPPPQPLTELDITYDASGGFAEEVPVSGTLLFRGPAATSYRYALAQSGKEELRKSMDQLRMGLPSKKETESYEFGSDDKAGTFTYTFKGKASLDLPTDEKTKAKRYHFSNYVISWDKSFEREAGPLSDAPFALPFPMYLTSRESVILPNKGEGFTLGGKDLETTIAGTYIARKLTIGGGKAVALSTFRRLKKEVPAEEAKRAKSAIKAIDDDDAYVSAPAAKTS